MPVSYTSGIFGPRHLECLLAGPELLICPKGLSLVTIGKWVATIVY